MKWTVLECPEFAVWFDTLDAKIQDAILAHVLVLEEEGPQLGRPHVDTVKGSRFKNMKELRVQVDGSPWRILFAFDRKRQAILLDGGDKSSDPRWYKTHIPIADQRFQEYLNSQSLQ